MPNNTQSNASFWQKYQLYFLLVAAIVIRQIPLVSIPLNWLETYFHEISHGIAALLTGGKIIQIQLFPNGSGLCTTQGGFNFLISFCGYAGATLWGWLLFKSVKSHQKTAQIITGLMVIVLLTSIALWARDLLTIIIIASLAAMFIFMLKMRRLTYLQLLMKFFGLSVLLNSLFSPTYLFDGRSLGDGVTLSAMTMIPEFIWVLIWCVIALFALYTLIKSNNR